MAIVIPHRFIDRLLPDDQTEHINTIIIGTFNPGLPIIDRLTSAELALYRQIEAKKKFQKFNEVKNFYDRPQNRFWKVMDAIAHHEFYENSPHYKEKNANGLKYYSKFNRDLIFQNQTTFCRQQGIMITDIVRQIEPTVFDNIYDNFPDTIVEGTAREWNTQGILSAIQQYNPERILINFKLSSTIPKISSAIDEIKANYADKVIHVMSTSGSAGNTYKDLVNEWKPLIKPS